MTNKKNSVYPNNEIGGLLSPIHFMLRHSGLQQAKHALSYQEYTGSEPAEYAPWQSEKPGWFL
jgi:hypothetical protein